MPRRKPGALTASEGLILADVRKQPGHPYIVASRLVLARRTVTEALARMEQVGYVRSKWEQHAQPDGRFAPPRRVYRLTPKGRRALARAEKGGG